MATRPTVGRIVLFRRRQPDPGLPAVAALITGVFEAGDGGDICTLTTFEPGRDPRPLPEAVREGDEPGTWHWPQRT